MRNRSPWCQESKSSASSVVSLARPMAQRLVVVLASEFLKAPSTSTLRSPKWRVLQLSGGSIGDLLAVGCWSKYPLLRFSLSQKVPKADPPTQERRSLGAFGLLSALVPSSRQCGIDSGETARLFSRWWKCSSSITTGQSITIWRSITTSPGAKYPLWKCKSVQRPVAHWARPPASAPGGRSAPRHLRNAKLAQEGRDRWRLEVEHLPSAFLSPVLGP